jgi:hypothetical protein
MPAAGVACAHDWVDSLSLSGGYTCRRCCKRATEADLGYGLSRRGNPYANAFTQPGFQSLMAQGMRQATTEQMMVAARFQEYAPYAEMGQRALMAPVPKSRTSVIARMGFGGKR